MTNRNNIKRDGYILATLDQLVREDHLVRKLEEAIDFTFIYPKVKPLYSEIGRPSIDPVILFKMVFINITFGINSMRKTCKEIEDNIAYRWFLGLSIDEKVPDYSTWSQNYIRRYNDSNIFEEIFDTIIAQGMQYGFIDTETVFGDSTHQKANANKNKSENLEVDIVTRFYEEALLKEINEDKIICGHKEVKSMVKEKTVIDTETGEITYERPKKNIKISKVDPESGCFHKGEKEKCFAYSHQTFCDKNGFVLSTSIVPGNIHDSTSFFEAYNVLNKKYPDIKNISLDAGYITPAICKAIFDNNQTPYMPYKRPMTKKGFFKKYDFVYDETYDCYICPNNKLLEYNRTMREGYRQYSSDKEDCKSCSLIDQCTKSKNGQKVILRHIWEEYVEETNHIRHTDKWKEIYPLRKETIERVYADCKAHHGLRYTVLRGLKKNQNQSWLIFACHNLKRISIWKAKNRLKGKKRSNSKELSSIFSLKLIFEKNNQKNYIYN